MGKQTKRKACKKEMRILKKWIKRINFFENASISLCFTFISRNFSKSFFEVYLLEVFYNFQWQRNRKWLEQRKEHEENIFLRIWSWWSKLQINASCGNLQQLSSSSISTQGVRQIIPNSIVSHLSETNCSKCETNGKSVNRSAS